MKLRTLAAALAGALLLSLGPVRAQEPPPEQEMPPPVVAGQNGGDPNDPFGPRDKVTLVRSPGFVTRQPYVNWKAHTGTAEQAVCLIRIGTPDGPASTALVIRCDGFLLVPSAVVEAQKNGTPLFVTVTGAENEEITAPLSVAGRIHNVSPRCAYGVLKVNDHHLRCVPILSASVVKTGIPLQVVVAQPGEKPGLCKSVTKPGVVGVRTAGTTGNEGEEAYVIDDITGDIPVGAVVVDKETGAAVGMVTRGGTKPVFSTFATLYDICSEVGIAPDRAAIKERLAATSRTPGVMAAKAAKETSDDMVWVPGGAVQLDGALGDYYRRTFKTDVACTPGFFISKHMVTRGDYQTWAGEKRITRDMVDPGALLPHRITPQEQAMVDEEFARYVAKLPEPLSKPHFAATYAADHGWRLPTEVEWRLASLCEDLGWAVGIMESADAQIRQLYAILQDRMRAWQRNVANSIAPPGSRPPSLPPSRRGGGAAGGGVGLTENLALLQANSPEESEAIFQIREAAANLTKAHPETFPWQVVPVGTREADKSIFGMEDAVMNMPEFVLGIGKQVQVAPKLLPARVDALESRFLVAHSYIVIDRGGIKKIPIEGTLGGQLLWYLYHGGNSNPVREYIEDRMHQHADSHLAVEITAMLTVRGILMDDRWPAMATDGSNYRLEEFRLMTFPVCGFGFRCAR